MQDSGSSSQRHGDLPHIRQSLERMTAQLALRLTPDAVDRLLSFWSLLQRWNGTYNLTAVRDPQAMLVQHIADCLAVVTPLSRELTPHASCKVMDVGSGGGLPGVVIAVTLPGVEVVCVDSVGKKAAFVRQVAADLRLPNLSVAHARVESMKPVCADVITSRAFSSLPGFISATQQHLAPHGVWMAMKGKNPRDEIVALGRRANVFHVEPLAVPCMTAERCIVWMRPGDQTK